MKNFDKWQSYTSGLSSPQNYIDWGWRYLIAASLQRRVWLGFGNQKCFPNNYTILVGKAGIGKGIILKEVSFFLKYWKQKDASKKASEQVADQQQKNIIEATMDGDYTAAKDADKSNHQKGLIEPLLIPVAADATTYEALVNTVAANYRFINYNKYDNKLQKMVAKIEGHSSMCFCLQELASLLRKRTEDTVNYMLGLYDCPDSYEYETVSRGKDVVTRGCLNVIAGTTPDFMQDIFKEKLLNQGFGSRSFFIYANKNRKYEFLIPELNPEQLQYQKEIAEHIFKLTRLYGCVKLEGDTLDYLQEWWREYNEEDGKKSNKSPKLEAYYARKNIHVMKLALALHFGESTEMSIPLETYKEAISILDAEEKNMHLAIVTEDSNQLSMVARRVLDLVSAGPKNMVTLLTSCYDIASKSQLEEAISFLEETNQLETGMVEEPITKRSVLVYKKKG